jgi:proliferating cell nuclear antigen PCNA
MGYSWISNKAQKMEFVPKDVSLFRSSVEALKEFLPIASLRCSADGIHISGMDASHVGFVDYMLSAADCSKAVVGRPLIISVSMAVLARVLSPVGAGDSVTLIYKADKFIVECYNVKMSKKAVYEVPTLDVDGDAAELPAMTYAANVTLKTADISAVVKEIAHFGDTLGVVLNEDGLHLSTVGDSGAVKQTLENTEDREMELTGDSVEARYGTKYVAMIIKGGAALSPVTQLEFDPTNPLRATFRFGGGSHFIAYLAPKVADE